VSRMPTYEYGCSACGQEWEAVQRITEPPTEVCPKCGKTTAHRLISAGTNFILKGGGWYSDLYSSPKGGGNKSETKGETSSDTKSTDKPSDGKPSGTSSESKPASGESKAASGASTSAPAPAPTSSS
jgi:putative FmdB family regulatory protein